MDHPLEKLVPGSVIDLAGQVLGNRNRFHINLETGTGEIALHVNPRFDEGEVVFNTLRNGRWEREKRVGRLPVQQGCSFEAMILVEEMGYKVAFNKCHFADFKHRLQYSMVKRLKVDGCVTIRRFEQKQPQEPSPSPVLPVLPSPMLPVLSSPFPPVQTTPLLRMLPGGHLAPGLTVQLSGRPHSDAKLFRIDFLCGCPGSDIAFHFNPRFPHKEMVRNTFWNGSWGAEERSCQSFPFRPGAYFDMLIRVLDSCFDVAVNGQPYLRYQHRLLPLQRISHFSVEGDVLLSSCEFQYL